MGGLVGAHRVLSDRGGVIEWESKGDLLKAIGVLGENVEDLGLVFEKLGELRDMVDSGVVGGRFSRDLDFQRLVVERLVDLGKDIRVDLSLLERAFINFLSEVSDMGVWE